jgi:hypothetical protein
MRGGRGGAPGGTSEPSSMSGSHPNATTIDALFGPLPIVESTGRVWLHINSQLKPVRVRLGISDGQFTELIEGELEPGVELVTNVNTGEDVRPSAVGGFPFGQPNRGGGAFPGRGGGGGGGGRGGGRGPG